MFAALDLKRYIFKQQMMPELFRKSLNLHDIVAACPVRGERQFHV